MDKVKITNLTPEYFSQFYNIFSDYFKNEVGYFYLSDENIKKIIDEKLLQQLKKEIISIDIALLENQIKGFIIYQIDSEKSDWNERTGHGFIREFYVDKNLRRSGIGTALLKNVETKLKKQGIANIYLTSSSEYYVEDFYYKNGYKNEYKCSPKNNNEYFSKEL